MKNKLKLIKDGFELVKIDKKNIIYLNQIKKEITKFVQVNLKNKKVSLENIHHFENKINDFNKFRLDIINKINKNDKFQKLIYEILSDKLINLFGSDISVQKNINLVIQQPGDDTRAIIHKDAPPESRYQVNIWLPLVDCKKTMSMCFFKPNKSKIIEKFLSSKNYKSEKMDIFSMRNGINPDVKFGHYIIFSPETWHHPLINKEKKTRWAINIRYKNTFSPYGKKGYLDYYKPISFSEITNFTLKNEQY
tara:strand:+ start:15821 stop:16570 length:750 start_codon:yes stop_codon:yes gene_type:complete